MNLFEWCDCHWSDHQPVRHLIRRAAWWIAQPAFEHIFEPGQKNIPRRPGSVAIDRSPHDVKDLPQIIDAMRMVGMIMCIKHCVEPGNICAQKLFSQVRAGIQEYEMPLGFDEYRNPAAAVARI